MRGYRGNQKFLHTIAMSDGYHTRHLLLVGPLSTWISELIAAGYLCFIRRFLHLQAR